MTDSNDKDGLPEKGDPPELSGSTDQGASSEKGGTPSTLEKAVAKVSKNRQAKADAEAKAKASASRPNKPKETSGTFGKGAVSAPPPRRSIKRKLVGALSVLILLAIGYVAWPVWGPTLPGWLQASLAPIMGASEPGSRSGVHISRLLAQIEPLEKEITTLKGLFAARPVADPARLLTLDDLVRQNGERLSTLKTEIDAISRGPVSEGRADEIAILSKRLDEMQVRLVALAVRPPVVDASSPADATAAIGALDVMRTQSNARMSALETENAALRNIVALLDKRVGAIEQRPTTIPGTTRSNALVLAVGQLREAGRGTTPFVAPLQAVEALAESQEALVGPLAALRPRAKTGVPDLIALRQHFNSIAGRIAHESFVPKGEGWVDRTVGKISRIFTFRRTGSKAAETDDENGRIARAELRLVAGDLAAAVTILEGLTEPGLSYAAPWLKEAHARLTVDTSIKALFSQALANARVTNADKGAPGG